MAEDNDQTFKVRIHILAHTHPAPASKLHVLYITIWSSGTRVETQDVVYSGVAMANRSSGHKSRKPSAGESLKEGLYSHTHIHSFAHTLTNTHIHLQTCV